MVWEFGWICNGGQVAGVESELNGNLETMTITDRILDPETVILYRLPV
jgi:hypothetical protein